MSKLQLNLLYIIIVTFFLQSINSTVLVKARKVINLSCDRNVYYIVIDIVFSEKPPEEYYPFTLNLVNPSQLNFKCMLDYPKQIIYCFRSLSEVEFIKSGTLFQFPYPFPNLEGIDWDYQTFLEKVYLKAWNVKFDCGNENIYHVYDLKYKKWNLEGELLRLNNGKFKVSALKEEDNILYNFDMTVSFINGDLVELLKDGKNKDQIELMQEIWVPLLHNEEKIIENKTLIRENYYAYCGTKTKINSKNYLNFRLNCHIPKRLIINGQINMNSFFDKLYIRQGKKVDIITININIKGGNDNKYASLDEKEYDILCQNRAVFNIESKDDITMGLYYKKTNNYTFFLVGTLTNNY